MGASFAFRRLWQKEKQNARDHCSHIDSPLASGICHLVHHGGTHSCPPGHCGRGDSDSCHSRTTPVATLKIVLCSGTGKGRTIHLLAVANLIEWSRCREGR